MNALRKALADVCDALEAHDANAPALHFARGVLAVGSKAGRRPMDMPNAEIVAAYAEGKSIGGIADQHGVSVPTIRRVLTEQGVEIRKRGSGQKAGTSLRNEKRFAEMKAAWDAGQTLTAIGQRFSITRERVRQVFQRHGIDTSPGSRPLSAAQKAAVADYAAGNSVAVVAERHGVGEKCVMAWVRRCGVPVHRRPKRHSPEVLANAQAAAAMYHSGATSAAIAERLGFANPATIYRYLAIAGVSPSRRRAV